MGLVDPFTRVYRQSLAQMICKDNACEAAGRMRADQISTLTNVTPLMMAANVANAFVILIFIYHEPTAWFLPYWTGAMCLFAGLGVYNWYRNRLRNKIRTASSRGLMKFIKSSAVFGVLWGMLPAILYPSVGANERILLIAIIAGMMGGGAMSLYTIPRAKAVWLIGIAGGLAIGLIMSAGWIEIGILLLLACYTLTLMNAGLTLALNYGQNRLNSYHLEEKSETIGLLLKEFSEGASDWLWECDQTGTLVYGQEEFKRHLGAVPACFCGVSGGAPENFTQIKGAKVVRDHWLKREAFRDLQVSANNNGETAWVTISGKPLIGEDGSFLGYRGVAADVTANKVAEERIAYLAHNDALTGLVNRTHFSRAICNHLKKAAPETFWAVMFLDLDGFKLVNDSKGHDVGDQVLEIVAKRIKKLCSDNDVVARLGGDEFAILCRDAVSIQALSTKAEKLIESVSASYDFEDRQALSGVGVSIGVAVGKRDGESEQELLHNADLALYRAKSEGKGTYRFFELEMDEIVRERRLLEQDLREALTEDQLSLSFQPLVSADGKETAGFEALVRWNHPERGLISPTEFIPIAESMGLISDIGDWVLLEACKKAIHWPEHLFVAVNLSPQQFKQRRIVDAVSRAIVETGISPSRLELEVTEGLLMDNTEEVTYTLRELKGMGISIALDDFGTGYSSLSYLLKFPFDKLKIDRSFISSIETDEVARNVLEAIARLGSVLDLKVTAEGVETVKQMEALSAFNCTHLQGFLFGKPLAHSDLAAYLLSETGGQMATQPTAVKSRAKRNAVRTS